MSSKVYYNSACPVSNAGIKDQRRRMEACGVKDIEWVHVHTNPEAGSEVGASLEHVRERLHVKDSDGQINIGADAFTCCGHKRAASAGLRNYCGYPCSSGVGVR
ncbi:MAG: DCC1-like thiol-disulfide oxidoreductase family protein [Gammaproteobacteria bacterium]